MTEKHSMPTTKSAKSESIKINRAKLIKAALDGKDAAGRKRYRFSVVCQDEQIPYTFFLSEEKAMACATKDRCFPTGALLKISGRTSSAPGKNFQLNHVKVHMIDGQDARGWAERWGSHAVDEEVVSGAAEATAAMERLDKAMRNRAPGQVVPLAFSGKKEAFEGAMFIVRRQMKKRDPRLTKTEILALRDALNILNDSAGG